MKKIICIFFCILLIFTLSACGKSTATQPGSFFDDSPRFILVDQSHNSGLAATTVSIYCDSVTGVLYMYIDGCYNGGITPLYNSDGSLMLYDEG